MKKVWVVTVDFADGGSTVIGVAGTLAKAEAIAREDYNEDPHDWLTLSPMSRSIKPNAPEDSHAITANTNTGHVAYSYLIEQWDVV